MHDTADGLGTFTVRSSDGAHVAYHSTGRGPAVLLLPGALSVAAQYHPFAEALARHFTVHTLERRGRGQSSPQGADHSMATEVADVLALQRKTGASLLVGHSFGGLIALEAALASRAITHVAVYEPGVSIGGSIPLGWIPRYEQYLAQGKRLDAFTEFARGSGPDRARRTPHWLMKRMIPRVVPPAELQIMLDLLTENLREHREVARFDGQHGRYRDVTARVLLMRGGRSGVRWPNTTLSGLAAVLPAAETRVFDALDHFGLYRAGAAEVAQAVDRHFRT